MAGLALGYMVNKPTAELRLLDRARAGRVLGLSSILTFPSGGSGRSDLLVSARAMWLAFGFNALWGVVLLGAAAVLAPRYGAFGLAASDAVAYAVHTAVQLSYFWIRCRDMREPSEAPTEFNVIIPKPNVEAPIGEPK